MHAEVKLQKLWFSVPDDSILCLSFKDLLMFGIAVFCMIVN